jgi:hypothetical protein
LEVVLRLLLLFKIGGSRLATSMLAINDVLRASCRQRASAKSSFIEAGLLIPSDRRSGAL